MVAPEPSAQIDEAAVSSAEPTVELGCSKPKYLASHVVTLRQFEASYDWAVHSHSSHLPAEQSYRAIQISLLMRITGDCQRHVLICCTNPDANRSILWALCIAANWNMNHCGY